MRTLLACCFLLIVASFPLPAQALGSELANEVQVVVLIKDLDDAGLARLAKEVVKEGSVTMEYSCVASGVVVLKYSGVSASERADAITMVRRTLVSAGLEKGMEVLNVQIEDSGPGKC